MAKKLDRNKGQPERIAEVPPASPAEHVGALARLFTVNGSLQEETADLISQLYQTLDPILCAPNPANAGAIANPSPYCAAGDQVVMAIERQRQLNARLNDILSRIAL